MRQEVDLIPQQSLPELVVRRAGFGQSLHGYPQSLSWNLDYAVMSSHVSTEYDGPSDHSFVPDTADLDGSAVCHYGEGRDDAVGGEVHEVDGVVGPHQHLLGFEGHRPQPASEHFEHLMGKGR
jgi:hypothetical protein